MKRTGDAPATIKELLTFRLNVLAKTMSKIAMLMNEREFSLDAREWRIIGLLGGFSPYSLRDLAREMDIDKSQASRTVSSMIERGLVSRSSDEKDGRGVQLSLTQKGRSVYRHVFPKAVERNEAVLDGLDLEDRLSLERILDRLTVRANNILEQERDRSASS